MPPRSRPFRIPGFDDPWPAASYDRSTVVVARALLGARLVHRTPDGDRVGRIVETEAYVAGDPASHAFGGPTPRNASMFAGPGSLYVFRIHQVHCANAVTRPGQAVLVRALAPRTPDLGDGRGPGRLCRALEIGPELDGSSLCHGPVRVLPRVGPPPRVAVGRRVGIRRAAERRLRFAIEGDPDVSSPRPWGRRAPTGA